MGPPPRGSDSLSSALIVAELSYSSSFLGTALGGMVVLDTEEVPPETEVSMGSDLSSVLTTSSFLMTLLLLALLLLLAAAPSFEPPFGTGELLPEAEGVALFCKSLDSSQDDVEDPDSSSEDRVGGWSPTCMD